MEKVKLFKINEGNLKCRYCGWMLTKLTKEEIKKLRLRFSFPRGVYRCDVCGELATITITVSGEDSFDEWEEKIEELPSSLQMTEKEAVDSVIQSIALLPDVSVKVECIGKALECEGLGLGCKLYYLASCGLGDSSICGDNYCKYDPYPEDYKQKFWYHADIETNIGNDIVAYWIQKLDEKSLETQKVDALKHLGSIKIREVKKILLDCLKPDKPAAIQEVAVMALIKFGFDSDVKSHVLTAMQTKEEFLLRAILRAVRKVRWADTEITEKVAYLTARSALTKEANFTLEVIKHNLK